jgi:hypothetical protein
MSRKHPEVAIAYDFDGHSMAVYKPKRNGAKALAGQLMEEGRVNFVAPDDYREGKTIDKQVKAVLQRIAVEVQLDKLGRR